MTNNNGKTPAERLEAALADMEAQRAAAAEFRDEHKAEFAAEIARLNAAHEKLAALPQQERRQVLAAAGLKGVSAAPKPLEPLRGGSFVRTLSQQAPEPINWKLWLNLPQVALWEAVALLLNIDPRSLKHSPQGWMAGPGTDPHFEPGSFPSPAKLTTFDDAMLLAARAANYAGPIHLRTGLAVGMNKRTALVALPEVVAFFVGCDWPDIPAPLLARVPAIAEPAPAVAESVPAEVASPKVASAPANWKMRVQAEAADHWRTLRASGANPTVASILDRMARWCRENDVRTDGNINPCANYLRTHVLAAKHWTPPA